MDATDTLNEATNEATLDTFCAEVRSGEADAGVPNEATVDSFSPQETGVNETKLGQMSPIAENSRKQLTPKQELAMPYVVAAGSIREGARAAQISRATVKRWMDDPAFRAELDDQRRAAVALARNEFQRLAVRSIQTLAELLEHSDARIRLSAARTITQTAIKTGDTQDIRQRMEVIDEAVELLKNQV